MPRKREGRARQQYDLASKTPDVSAIYAALEAMIGPPEAPEISEPEAEEALSKTIAETVPAQIDTLTRERNEAFEEIGRLKQALETALTEARSATMEHKAPDPRAEAERSERARPVGRVGRVSPLRGDGSEPDGEARFGQAKAIAQDSNPDLRRLQLVWLSRKIFGGVLISASIILAISLYKMSLSAAEQARWDHSCDYGRGVKWADKCWKLDTTGIKYGDVASRSAITDIQSLAGLNALRSLDLRDMRIEDLTPLADLEALQYLCPPKGKGNCMYGEIKVQSWLDEHARGR